LKQVALTGMGIVSPFGVGSELFQDALVTGRGAACPITRFKLKDWCNVKLAATVPQFSLEDLTKDTKESKRASPQLQLAWAAMYLAMKDSNLDLSNKLNERTGLFAGYGRFGTERMEDLLGKLLFGKFKELLPVRIESLHPHGTTAHLGYLYNIVGPTMTFCASCQSGIQALDAALTNLKLGKIEIAIVLAADLISNFQFHAEAAAGILSPETNPKMVPRPYDREADGQLLSEGAVALVFEHPESAIERGARIRARLVELKTIIDTCPFPPESLKWDMSPALSQLFKNLDLTDLNLLCADGRGIPYWDQVESRAIEKALGASSDKIPVTSIHGNLGHAGGTSSLFQIAATTLSMEQSIISPINNLDHTAEGCNLDFVTMKPRHSRINKALVVSHSWAGDHNALLMQGALS